MINKTKKWLLHPIIKERVTTFCAAGYQEVTVEELWQYVLEYRWKKRCPQTLQAMKIDLRQITPNNFFDYQQIKAVQKKDFDDLNYLM